MIFGFGAESGAIDILGLISDTVELQIASLGQISDDAESFVLNSATDGLLCIHTYSRYAGLSVSVQASAESVIKVSVYFLFGRR